VQSVKEFSALLDEYQKSLSKLVENSKSIDELTTEMAESAAAIMQGSGAMKAALLSDQQRLESESDASISETERLIAMLAAGGFLLGGVLAVLLGGNFPTHDRHVQGHARTRRRQFRCRAAGPRARDELGEMAGAVEEFSRRPSPRRNGMPPRRMPRTAPAARRAVPSSFVSPTISRRR
jgi:hypothetical protein